MSTDFINDNEAILAEHLEQALQALAKGLPIEPIIEHCPQPLRMALREMLPVAERVTDLTMQAVPPRTAARRAQGRADFLKMAQQMRLGEATVGTNAPLIDSMRATSATSAQPAQTLSAQTPSTQMTGSAVNRKPVPVEPSLLERFRAFLNSLGTIGAPMSMAMAPVLALLVLMVIGSVGVAQAAYYSLPGDTLYSAKEWGRDIQLSLASEAEQEKLRQKQEDTRRKEIERAATERTVYVQQTREFIVYGERGQWTWDIGGLVVKPFYIPDPSNPDGLVWMSVTGDPKPGDTVRLTYQIVPGFPNIVMGVSMEVVAVAQQATAPTPPIVSSTQPTPAVTIPPLAQQCIPAAPAGWMGYRIRRTDTLSNLAVDGNTQVAKLIDANCLESDIIQLGSVIFVPATPKLIARSNDVPSAQPSPTPTAIPVFTATETATVAVPTATSTQPAETMTTPIATATTGETPASGDVLTPTVESSPTLEAGPTTEAGTPVETPGVTPAVTKPAATETPDPNATIDPSITPGTGTPTGTSMPQETPVATPSTEGTEVAAPTPEATVPVNATAIELPPTTDPAVTSTKEPVATEQATVVSSGDQPTLTPILESSPTPVPPTPIPPTPIPPTPIAATPGPPAVTDTAGQSSDSQSSSGQSGNGQTSP